MQHGSAVWFCGADPCIVANKPITNCYAKYAFSEFDKVMSRIVTTPRCPLRDFAQHSRLDAAVCKKTENRGGQHSPACIRKQKGRRRYWRVQ